MARKFCADSPAPSATCRDRVLAGGVLNILDIPFIFIIASVMALIIGLVLSRTVFGQKVYLTGSNPRAALFSGINVQRLTFFVYLLSGLLSGIAGFVFLMRLGAARPDAGDPLLLPITGAVVVQALSLAFRPRIISRKEVQRDR